MFRKSLSIDLVEPVVYLRGQPKDKQTINILRGAIRLQLSHSAIVHSVTIKFIGISKTLWPEASQHWDKHILVDSTIPISKNSLLLKKGTHAFPFEILLSNALSESIECGLGHIRYKLLCQVHVKPAKLLFFKTMLQTQKHISLIRLPSLESQQQSITQTHVINEQGGQLTIHIEKAHLIPDTSLPINFNFNPSCFVHAVEQVSVKLVERQKYRAPAKQITRILHHEIALSPPPNLDHRLNNNELCIVYVVPDKHSLKVRQTSSHTNIKIRHWIQIYLKLLLKDGTTKEIQMEASIAVLLSAMDDYLTLPVYNTAVESSSSLQQHLSSSTSMASSITTSMKQTYWFKKIYPVKQDSLINTHQNLMMLMTAPPPLYEDIY